ncbi:putative 39S ribosomal protein L14, mitochondrial [Hypsibius exemplaris]|uniref:Large ribosomal subunit protein uL14m n=1 Tax=Hypsibius exemplaris TaxID=2072580 RepID=A0A1W0WF04_HYPEX|nr:putative 39S ribosomal protein L14, mitochondrial [Hypsibius exemplaris]
MKWGKEFYFSTVLPRLNRITLPQQAKSGIPISSHPRQSTSFNMISRICSARPPTALLHNLLPAEASFFSLASSSSFSTSATLFKIRKLTRMRVVDNSALGQQATAAGKPAKVFHIYNKTSVGGLGDKVMCAIMGQKKRGYIVGVVRRQRDLIPTMDTNNLVLINDDGSPLGTRITVPIPMMLRSKRGDIAKILSIATRFV